MSVGLLGPVTQDLVDALDRALLRDPIGNHAIVDIRWTVRFRELRDLTANLRLLPELGCKAW